MNNDERTLLYDTAERVFTQHCTPATLAEAEADSFPQSLWMHLSDTGLLDALLPEALGGVEAQPSVLAGILRIAGRFGAPGPIAETMIGRRLLAANGVEAPDGPLLLAINGWRTKCNQIFGSVRHAPEAPILVSTKATGDTVRFALQPTKAFEVREHRNLAGERLLDVTASASTITNDGFVATATAAERTTQLLSLARAALIVGAIERVMDLSLVYTGQRVQFGRQISKFQAIQQQLAALAGAAAAASAIVFAAAREADRGAGVVLLDAARIRLADIIDLVSGVGHQVHGAIGVTREYQLHYFTRRLWAWRDEATNLPQVRQSLAARFAGCDADGLWPKVVTLSAGDI